MIIISILIAILLSVIIMLFYVGIQNAQLGSYFDYYKEEVTIDGIKIDYLISDKADTYAWLDENTAGFTIQSDGGIFGENEYICERGYEDDGVTCKTGSNYKLDSDIAFINVGEELEEGKEIRLNDVVLCERWQDKGVKKDYAYCTVTVGIYWDGNFRQVKEYEWIEYLTDDTTNEEFENNYWSSFRWKVEDGKIYMSNMQDRGQDIVYSTNMPDADSVTPMLRVKFAAYDTVVSDRKVNIMAVDYRLNDIEVIADSNTSINNSGPVTIIDTDEDNRFELVIITLIISIIIFLIIITGVLLYRRFKR